MSLQVKLALQGVNMRDFAQQVHLRTARGARNAAEIMQARAKVKLRADVQAGGLGPKVANTWRADIYPRDASKRTHTPAVQVYSKAPLIISAFSADTEILPKRGTFLVVPTKNAPKVGRRGRGAARQASLAEAVLLYRGLIFRPQRNGNVLVFGNVVRSRGKRGGYRPLTPGRRSRQAELVLLFVLVRQVHLAKRLEWPRLKRDLLIDWGKTYGGEINRALTGL